ncbi:S8 family serine peptidase [Kribbella catacumbae]|uniref:S8 family serine peptidase n=1 Tax=Kribbella catacumbae TaxID=460086 RepID=UPI0003602E05|nr:S8 family serine peptidase [Kribbella catacumbae]
MTAVASLAVLSLGVTAVGQAQATRPGQAGDSTAKTSKTSARDKIVTLVTGDRIILRGGDPAKASIQPGPGRDKVSFRAHRQNGQLLVIPSDVSAAITAGKLDRRLFDVTALIKAGYDDSASKVIPVVVTYQGKAKRSAPAGATVSRNLPVINGAALKVEKKHAVAFLTAARSARSATGIDKIWLDGKRQLSLDQSVPQIGAPAAWQAGFTGKGVSVAVLDTGIDATHPDLASQVAGAKNFTTDPAGDQVGHGTHVASTIAGTAAASAGKYKGVAPDAKLYDGKVCEQGGCTESAILGGMEWAATEVKAKVVNISLGGQDSPELDPLEEAVNRLTAQTGTLFVIAAGNSGPDAGTVDSPGSADAALTVGAVDKENQLAFFSSRGPRTGDGALKPDVTAPGVGIVAAKSKDGVIGEPVGDKYLRLSGTSMATPHTVGAAAILAQQHPGWKATELKGALMASAKAADGQTSYEQGAGRIDVAKAITQSVIAEPGGVSFGTALWPHTDDTPVTKTVTYRNLGDQPVTLALAATLTDSAGAPAPADSLKLSATSVTVPAGGTASVRATSNTKHNGPDGIYSGRITATAGGTSVVAPVGLNKEVESYTLTVDQLGLDGKPMPEGGTLVWGVTQRWFNFYSDPSGTVKVRLPKGEYLLQGDQFVQRPGTEIYDTYMMVQPLLELKSDQKVVMDARTTKPVTTTIPNKDGKPILADLGYDRTNADQNGGLSSTMLTFDFEGMNAAQLGGPAPAGQMMGHLISDWGLQGADGRFTNTPFLYGLVNLKPDGFFTGFHRAVQARELATVTQRVNATGDRRAERIVMPSAPGLGGAWTPILNYNLPAKTTLLVDAGPVGWQTDLSEVIPDPDPEIPWPVTMTRVSGPETRYKAGKAYQERYNAATFAPTPLYTTRNGNTLELGIFSTTDADGNSGATLADSQGSKLYRDGKLVGESEWFGDLLVEDLPAEKGSYKFISSLDRSSLTKFSSKIDLTFTFSSAQTGSEGPIPLRTVGYQPAVDSRNTVKRSPVTVLPITLAAQPDAALPAVKKLELQVSGDDGKTWKPASVVRAGAGYKAIFATPAGGAISLKAHLVDAVGNTTDQTVIGAYLLR